MQKHDVITLVAENPGERGVYEDATDTERMVYCTVRSVGMRESYEAMAHGKRPELVFVLSQDFEYQGEKRVIYHNVRYDVIRTYVTEADGIELTVERMVQ